MVDQPPPPPRPAIPQAPMPPPPPLPASAPAAPESFTHDAPVVSRAAGSAGAKAYEPGQRSESFGRGTEGIGLQAILKAVVRLDASDLHISAGRAAKVRVHGSLKNLIIEGSSVIPSTDETQEMLYSIITQSQAQIFEEHKELDFGYKMPELARFRANYSYGNGGVAQAVFRLIPEKILSLSDLGLPDEVRTFIDRPNGLVLVTGPTGSGKSTTLAAIINEINRVHEYKIITIEDPVEFTHEDLKARVVHRELGQDTRTFAAALKHVLRQDPDVILVGEMRDPETIALGVTAAETGHLVFATLHTQDASSAVDRLIDSFPAEQQEQIRVQLAGSLQGVVAQRLLRVAQGSGRVAAVEILVGTDAVRNLIREGKTHQIYSSIQTGSRDGMRTMEQSLAELVRAQKISPESAYEASNRKGELQTIMGGAR